MIPWTFQKLSLLLIFTFYYIQNLEIIYNLGNKTVLYLICNCISVKRKSEAASVNTDSQWSKQEVCFACATRVWLAVNHNTSVTPGKWIRCWKRIARASDLGSCQSNLCHSWGYERLQKSKDSLKACFENVNIHWWMLKAKYTFSFINICCVSRNLFEHYTRHL